LRVSSPRNATFSKDLDSPRMSNEYLRMRSKLWALALVALASCTKPNPASCADDFCNDPALPFCDVDGSIGGVPDTCIAVQCTAGEFMGCRDDNALTCNETGTNVDETACEFGCGDAGCLPCNTADCQPPEKHIIPRYVPTACDAVATTQLAITDDVEIDTGVDSNCTAIVQQTTGPEICVVHHDSITIAANRTMRARGTRALALVADHEFNLDGVVDASADQAANGPGGGTKKSGTGGFVTSDNNVIDGGGGAGNRTAGGSGANEAANGGADNGGAAEPNLTTLAELFGGTQATKSTTGAASGGAGGALTLVCCRCTLSLTGLVDVNGDGGRGETQSFMAPFKFFAASGGGSGGNVVLQGMQLAVNGQVFSNGGGGGGGSGGGQLVGSPGEKGRRDITCAAGAGSAGGGRGGVGGCDTAPGGIGVAAENPGAGGGSTGFLLTYTPSGVIPMLSPFKVSPPFEPNGVIATNVP
jgi:hypothetical protein